MNNWQPDVKFEEGVFKFDLPNGDEFVIVPPQTKPCNGFCGEQECRENQANCSRLKSKLSDEEILEVWRENERVYPMDRSRLLDRTRACIKKASEK